MPDTSDAQGPLPTCKPNAKSVHVFPVEFGRNGYLDLHPALQVVAEEVGGDGVEHVDGERAESDGLLVVVVPGAAQAAGLVPHFLHERIVLDDDGVLDEGSRRRRSSESGNSLFCPMERDRWMIVRRMIRATIHLVGGGGHAARVEVDVEGSAELSGTGTDVNAIRVAVVALREDHAVERPVELHVHPHVRLLALHLQVLDLRLVARRADRPRVVRARGDGSLAGELRRHAVRGRRGEQSGAASVRRNVVGRQRNLALVRRGAGQGERSVDAAVLERQAGRVGRLIGTDDLQSPRINLLKRSFSSGKENRYTAAKDPLALIPWRARTGGGRETWPAK